jgi:predicted N-acetyltransferase YhbS
LFPANKCFADGCKRDEETAGIVLACWDGARKSAAGSKNVSWSRTETMQISIEHLMDCTRCIPTVAAWQQTEFGYLSPAGTVEQRIERLSAASDRGSLPISLVALSEDQGQLVGSANVVAATLTHKHLTPWLSSVVVPVEHRGKEIASKLALAAVSEARRLGFREIHLFTPKNESLYARLGWATFDRAAINGVPVCVMVRSTS